MKLKEPIIILSLTCENCVWEATARTGDTNNFDAAIRESATHVRKTGHRIAVEGLVFPHELEVEKEADVVKAGR